MLYKTPGCLTSSFSLPWNTAFSQRATVFLNPHSSIKGHEHASDWFKPNRTLPSLVKDWMTFYRKVSCHCCLYWSFLKCSRDYFMTSSQRVMKIENQVPNCVFREDYIPNSTGLHQKPVTATFWSWEKLATQPLFSHCPERTDPEKCVVYWHDLTFRAIVQWKEKEWLVKSDKVSS